MARPEVSPRSLLAVAVPGCGSGPGGAEMHPDLFAGEPKSVAGESMWELRLSILITEGLRWLFRSLV